MTTRTKIYIYRFTFTFLRTTCAILTSSSRANPRTRCCLIKMVTVARFSSDFSQRWQGTRQGIVVKALASDQCVSGSIPGPGVICGLSLLLVLYSAPRGFSPDSPVFSSPQKPTFLNSMHSFQHSINVSDILCGWM